MTTVTSDKDLQAKIDKLEEQLAAANKEIASLKKQPSEVPTSGGHKARNVGSGVLIGLTTIVSVITLLAVWLSTTVLDTNRYVTTMSPLVSDPAVQATVSQRITDELFTQVDVATQVRAALPPNAQALAAPLTSQMQSFVADQIQTVMGTDAFKTAWDGANRVTQSQISSLLLGSTANGVLQNQNGTITLNLNALVTQVIAQMHDAGVTLFDQIPVDKVQGSIELGHSDELEKASAAAQALHTARYVAPIILLIMVGAALALATNRRKAAGWLGVAFALGMLIVGGLLAIGHEVAMNQASQVELSPATAAAVFETVTRFLVRSVQVIFLLGVIVTLAAIFTGQGRAAIWLKESIGKLSNRLANFIYNQGWDGGEVSVGLDRQIVVTRTIIVAAAAVILLTWSHPTVAVLLWMVAVTLVLLFAIEAVRKIHSVDGSKGDNPAINLNAQ